MFKTVNSSSIITKEDVLNAMSEIDILMYYFNIKELPILINSPLRSDKKASFGLFSPNGVCVRYKDFATGESGNIFNLLMNLWNLNYCDTLNKIYKDINNNINKINVTSKNSIKINNNKSTLNVKTRDWKQHDIEFWSKYGITLDWLKFGDVYPISYILLTKNESTQIISADKYAYVYVERKDDNITLKIYQPYNKKLKWMSKHDSSVIDLWTKLPESGDNLIITSSRKDSLCLWANTGIPSISFQSESILPKDKIIFELKNRFKNIFIFFDNDFSSNENHGQIFAKRLCNKYELKNIYIPSEYESKDPSDLFKNHGKEIFINLIKNLTNYEVR